MNNKTILGAIACLVIGIGIGAMATNSTTNKTGSVKNIENNNSGMHSTMAGMTTGLESKSGDEFDKTFIAEMILHHQGAIDMANMAMNKAQHQEIKDLSKAIVSAQTSEIAQMKLWQEQWYK